MPPDPIIVPDTALEERFLAATGPGGQNVNKVATAVQLRCDTAMLALPEAVAERLKTLAGSRMNARGEIILTARAHRSQEANRIAARARLAELLARAQHRDPPRRKTRPSRAAKAKRVDAKVQRKAVKAGRARPDLD